LEVDDEGYPQVGLARWRSADEHGTVAAMRFELDDPTCAHLLRWVQDGVVARRQLLEFGATPNDIERLLRRRELVVAHPGVYLNHTGNPSRAQREWIAVHAAWPAALAFDSALPEPASRVIHVAVAPGRRLEMPERSIERRMARLDERVDWNRSPPRVRPEQATIDVVAELAARDRIADAYARLADVLHSRRVGPADVGRALAQRNRVPRRAVLEGMLADITDGSCSVLERGYLHRVERGHGLPVGVRQRRSETTGRRTAQDVRYERYGVVVELDGRAHHESARARDRDALRDLAELAVDEALTARVTYGLVFAEQCRTATWIGSLLHRRGWSGRLSPCPECA
jgi:hypothetical protein